MAQERYILSGGHIVTEKEVLSDHILIIEDNLIKSITPSEHAPHEYSHCLIDCTGKYILPGLIDIHSDVIESIIVPRKGIIFDYSIALQEADRQLISQGITTMYHSISIANSTICNRKRTLSVNEMLQIGEAIHDSSDSLLIHNRFHARLELNTIGAFEGICKLIEHGIIHELSLMNHAPGQGQYADLENFKREIKKQYGEITSRKMHAIISDCQSKPLLEQSRIAHLLALANDHGIPIAFHDVGTSEQIEFMLSHGISICEFPLSVPIAAEATQKGLYNVVGAPNVLKNKSQNNNASATLLLKANQAHILCSDYFSPSMLLAVFALFRRESIPLEQAVAYASINPAKAVCIDRFYGSLKPGKFGDVLIVEIVNDLPRVTTAFINGKRKLTIAYER